MQRFFTTTFAHESGEEISGGSEKFEEDGNGLSTNWSMSK